MAFGQQEQFQYLSALNFRLKPKVHRQRTTWTPELDKVLESAWTRGGFAAARNAIQQYQPTWTVYSIRRRAAELQLPSHPAARHWTPRDVEEMLWAIDSNASLVLIAERLGRSVSAVRHKLHALGYTVESLGGYKVKEIAEMLQVPPERVRYWVVREFLLTKGGRITESSFSKFLAEHPQKVPFGNLRWDMQAWLVEMGYPPLNREPERFRLAEERATLSTCSASAEDFRERTTIR